MERPDREGTILITGRNAVLVALRTGRDVREVRIDRSAVGTPRVTAITKAAEARHVRVEMVDRRELDRIAGANHQGVVAVAREGPQVKLKDVLARCEREGRVPCMLLFREILHEHNLGAILRTADASGVDAIVLPSQGAAPLGAEAVRVSTGASETIPVVRQSLTQALAVLRREGVRMIGAEPEAPTDHWDADMTGPAAFVLGGENRALSPPLRDACDALVRIPMVGAVTSLNVSVACAILLYERLRQMRVSR